jgi:DNA-binding transcriptional MerR regulator
MNVTIPEKAYFRIGEVSRILGVEPYVVRYWETEFKSIRPERSSSSQRLYRRKDLEQLLLIKDLLYNKKFTISGARQKLLDMKKSGTAAEGREDSDMLMEIKRGLLEIRKLIS